MRLTKKRKRDRLSYQCDVIRCNIQRDYLIHHSDGRRGLVSNIINSNTISIETYVGSSGTPINFGSNEGYTIFRPRNAVVDYIVNATELDTDQYTNYSPDFDTNEYYRIIPAARSYTGTATNDAESGGIDYLQDTAADFIAMGVEVGDIIWSDHAGGDWGEIIALNSTVIASVLYGDHEHFKKDDDYTIYYDYVYSREHIVRPRFSGNQATTNVSEVRSRDVCLGYNSDCTTASASNFTGNGATPLLTVIDLQEDGTTDVGTATFTPSAGSSGSLKVADIKFSLAQSNGDIPGWLLKNDWHKLVYIAYSSGDAPGAASVCTTGTNCLTLDGASLPGNDKRALLITAGNETNTLRDINCDVLGTAVTQDRTSGEKNSYFELENCDAADDVFSRSPFAENFNDQIRVLSTSP